MGFLYNVWSGIKGYETVNVRDLAGNLDRIEFRPRPGVEPEYIARSVSRKARSLEAKGHPPGSIFLKYYGEDGTPIADAFSDYADYEFRAGAPRRLAGDTSAGLGVGDSVKAGGVLFMTMGVVTAADGLLNADYYGFVLAGGLMAVFGYMMLITGAAIKSIAFRPRSLSSPINDDRTKPVTELSTSVEKLAELIEAKIDK